MNVKPKLFDFVRLTDEEHKDFGKTGQLTDFDTIAGEYVLHFDKLTKGGNVYWISDSTRVHQEQVERISKLELDRI
jgi:hypothetical protein